MYIKLEKKSITKFTSFQNVVHAQTVNKVSDVSTS